MLTKDQAAEWTEQVRYARGFVNDIQAGLWAATRLAVDLELTALRQWNQVLSAQLATVRDGSNAHAANLIRMALENVELHTTLARYKAALKIYNDDGNWTYNTANDDCIWARDEHPATIAAKALHEDGKEESESCRRQNS